MIVPPAPDLYWFPIRGWFAESICDSYAGGVNELEIGGAVTTREAAASLEQKIRAELPKSNLPDISLWLTATEAMCLASASLNCAMDGLPRKQIARIDLWHGKWRDSDFCKNTPEEPA